MKRRNLIIIISFVLLFGMIYSAYAQGVYPFGWFRKPKDLSALKDGVSHYLSREIEHYQLLSTFPIGDNFSDAVGVQHIVDQTMLDQLAQEIAEMQAILQALQ